MNISAFEIKVYRALLLLGLLLLAATYFIRWKIAEPNTIISFVLNSMPNFCIAMTLPFMVLLIFNKYKTGFLIKNKAKIFYSTMPLLTILFILQDTTQLYTNKPYVDMNNMIMSIVGMIACIMIFEAINKPITFTSYKDITKPDKKAS